MGLQAFKDHNLLAVREALHIAEDATGDHFKCSARQWKKNLFDVKTLSSLSKDEIRQDALALLCKGYVKQERFDWRTRSRDLYFICLQDHQILKALRRDSNAELLPLLVYIFTHELVHIVRFSNFIQRFEVSGREREREESIVHATTYEILRRLSLPKLDYILDSYRGHRVCGTGPSRPLN